jgi:hypothetical protein
LLASRLRQHQISGGPAGGGAEAAKQMVLQQLAADLRQGHHMLLQGMGRSTGGGGSGDGGLHLPLSLGGGGSGSDVQALLKAAANSAVLIHHLLCSNPLAAFFPVKNLESFCKKKKKKFAFLFGVRYREEKPPASSAVPSPDRSSSSNSVFSRIRRFRKINKPHAAYMA